MSSNWNGEYSKSLINQRTSAQKDIVVSIIISESIASLLEIGVIHLEDILDSNSTNSSFLLNELSFLDGHPDVDSTSSQAYKDFWSVPGINSGRNGPFEINKEIGYFATQFSYDSETSMESYDDLSRTGAIAEREELTPDQPLHLQPCRVITRPLLAAKTTAHEDKIKYQANNICISIMDSDLTITSSGWVNFCRICHGGESAGRLIAPCRCRGSIALAHLECLEEWLKQSNNSRCELCQHRYEIIREPTYSIPWSVVVFLMNPGERLKELLLDVLGFAIYTPTAIASTYLLMVLCDNIAVRNNLQVSRSFTPHFLAFTAVFGAAQSTFKDNTDPDFELVVAEGMRFSTRRLNQEK